MRWNEIFAAMWSRFLRIPLYLSFYLHKASAAAIGVLESLIIPKMV